MTQLLQKTIERLRALSKLPEREQDRIAERVLQTLERTDSPSVRQRTPDLGKGTIKIAEDFDAPLPDAFWLGEQ